jgi:hypothetical protein
MSGSTFGKDDLSRNTVDLDRGRSLPACVSLFEEPRSRTVRPTSASDTRAFAVDSVTFGRRMVCSGSLYAL